MRTATIFPILFFLLLCSQARAESGRVYFDVPATSYPPGAKFTVTLFADTEVPINAVSLEIGYTMNTLAFVSSDAGESWVTFWRNFPPSPQNGVLNLEGGMTMPFKGKGGELIKLTFLAKEEGEAQISFRKATFFTADGKGTPFSPLADPLDITLSQKSDFPPEGQSIAEVLEGAYDTIKPELADFRLLEDPAGQLLLVFRPQDRESGIYQVGMRQRKWLLWEEEKAASSPIVVEKGVWNIKVKATDNAGNSTVRTAIVWGEAAKKLFAAAALFLGALAMKQKLKDKIHTGTLLFWKRKKKG